MTTNKILPAEERLLTPEEVDRLDKRRRYGQFLLVMGFQFGLIATLVLLWAGQDLQYSPGWARPMFYWDCITGLISIVCLVTGIRLRRGINEFFSY
jgi:hypothetical protein